MDHRGRMKTIDDFPDERRWIEFRLGLAKLKVKIKTLAEEARIIRHQERAWLPGPAWTKVGQTRVRVRPPVANDDVRLVVNVNLHQHRVAHVRPEARASLLAYAFLRGVSHARVEATKMHTRPDWRRVEQIVKKFGYGDPRDLMQRYSEWKAEADKYLPKEMR